MRKLLVLTVILSLFLLPAFAQQEKSQQAEGFQSYLPEKVAVEVEKAVKAKSGNGIYEISIFNKADYYGQQGNVFEVVFFKMSLEEEKPAEEQKKEAVLPGEMEHHLFLRIYKISDGKVEPAKEYNAPIPSKKEGVKFYTFAYVMPAGKYALVIAVTNSDFSKIGTAYYETELPVFTPKKDEILYSTPIFIKEIKQLLQPEVHFTVVPNAFYFGQASIYPYPEAVFKATDQPILFFQLYGIGVDPAKRTCNAEAEIVVKKGDKKYVKYKKIQLLRPGMYQPLLFKKKDKPFEEGEYVMEISIKDKMTGKKIVVKIPFKIVK